MHIKKSETKDNILAPAIEESWAAKKRLILCDAKEVVEEIKERERGSRSGSVSRESEREMSGLKKNPDPYVFTRVMLNSFYPYFPRHFCV